MCGYICTMRCLFRCLMQLEQQDPKKRESLGFVSVKDVGVHNFIRVMVNGDGLVCAGMRCVMP